MLKPKLPAQPIPQIPTPSRVDSDGGADVVGSPGQDGVLSGVQGVEVEWGGDGMGSDAAIADKVIARLLGNECQVYWSAHMGKRPPATHIALSIGDNLGHTFLVCSPCAEVVRPMTKLWTLTRLKREHV